MSSWEEWPYLFGFELLHGYEAGTKVTIFRRGVEKSVEKKFKEWRGIVSHVYDYVKGGGSVSVCVVFWDRDMNLQQLLLDAWNDRSPTVQCYPLDEFTKWKAA